MKRPFLGVTWSSWRRRRLRPVPVANHDVRNARGAVLVHKKTMPLTMFLLENLIAIPAPMGFSLWNKDIRSQSSCKPSCVVRMCCCSSFAWIAWNIRVFQVCHWGICCIRSPITGRARWFKIEHWKYIKQSVQMVTHRVTYPSNPQTPSHVMLQGTVLPSQHLCLGTTATIELDSVATLSSTGAEEKEDPEQL